MSDKLHLPLDAKILLIDMWIDQYHPPKPKAGNGTSTGKGNGEREPSKKSGQDEPER